MVLQAAPADELGRSATRSASREEQHMTATKAERVYHRLVVAADPNTVIWLVDDAWHPVQRAVGMLDTSVLPGRYFVELGDAGLQGAAYSVELFSGLRLTQAMLEAGPVCQRQVPVLSDE
jgi:hypothetical protein